MNKKTIEEKESANNIWTMCCVRVRSFLFTFFPELKRLLLHNIIVIFDVFSALSGRQASKQPGRKKITFDENEI